MVEGPHMNIFLAIYSDRWYIDSLNILIDVYRLYCLTSLAAFCSNSTCALSQFALAFVFPMQIHRSWCQWQLLSSK